MFACIASRVAVDVARGAGGSEELSVTQRGWGGEVADRHVRFVFCNEPVERLELLWERVRAALAAA